MRGKLIYDSQKRSREKILSVISPLQVSGERVGNALQAKILNYFITQNIFTALNEY